MRSLVCVHVSGEHERDAVLKEERVEVVQVDVERHDLPEVFIRSAVAFIWKPAD